MDRWIIAMYLVSVAGALAAMFWPPLLAAFRNGPGIAQTYRVGGGGNGAYIAAAVVIAFVVSALGFFAFAQSALRDDLKALGALAYFSAFTFGFSAGSAIEEPLKKPV